MREPDSSLRMILVSIQEGGGSVAVCRGGTGVPPVNQAHNARLTSKLACNPGASEQ
jgi:hypothetical protein